MADAYEELFENPRRRRRGKRRRNVSRARRARGRRNPPRGGKRISYTRRPYRARLWRHVRPREAGYRGGQFGHKPRRRKHATAANFYLQNPRRRRTTRRRAHRRPNRWETIRYPRKRIKYWRKPIANPRRRIYRRGRRRRNPDVVGSLTRLALPVIIGAAGFYGVRALIGLIAQQTAAGKTLEFAAKAKPHLGWGIPLLGLVGAVTLGRRLKAETQAALTLGMGVALADGIIAKVSPEMLKTGLLAPPALTGVGQDLYEQALTGMGQEYRYLPVQGYAGTGAYVPEQAGIAAYIPEQAGVGADVAEAPAGVGVDVAEAAAGLAAYVPEQAGMGDMGAVGEGAPAPWRGASAAATAPTSPQAYRHFRGGVFQRSVFKI